jgi:hypothetical protein
MSVLQSAQLFMMFLSSELGEWRIIVIDVSCRLVGGELSMK